MEKRDEISTLRAQLKILQEQVKAAAERAAEIVFIIIILFEHKDYGLIPSQFSS
jgi:hypothetical protein